MLRRFEDLERAPSDVLAFAAQGIDVGSDSFDFSSAEASTTFNRPAFVMNAFTVDVAFGQVGNDAQRSGYNEHTWMTMCDRMLATLALILLAPLMLVVAFLISASDGWPVLFRHERVGLGGKGFKCYKFRTMRVDADVRLRALLASDPVTLKEWRRDHKLRSDPRVTAVGRFLRKSSFDELPQLFNVLRGEMSMVGPRPIIREETVRYGRYYAHYIALKPGITGLWQVSGRNRTSYRRRVALDTVQLRTMSVRTYFSILLRTVIVVVTAHGAY